YVYFFFQAEDGIRDFHVTGVQTCALPISGRIRDSLDWIEGVWERTHSGDGDDDDTDYDKGSDSDGDIAADADKLETDENWTVQRSEERRVGKECRTRGSAKAEQTK